jgi:hypothetical protein
MLMQIVLLVGGLELFPVASAQGPGAIGARHYNPATEINVDGVIESFVYRDQARHRSTDVGVHFNLSVKPFGNAETSNYFVHVGPKSLVSPLIEDLQVGDRVVVIGSSIKMDGKNALIARQILKDGKRVTIRDFDGRPVFRNGVQP